MNPAQPTYQRAPTVVFRWLRGAVLVMGQQGQSQKLEGAAAVVWMALPSPATAAEVRARIQEEWPALGTIDEPTLTEALGLLGREGLVIEAI